MRDGTSGLRSRVPKALAWLNATVIESRFSYSALAVSGLLFGLSLAGFLISGIGAKHLSRGTELESIRDAAAEHSLTKALEVIGVQNCYATMYSVTSASFWVVGVRAIAYVRCQAEGSGAQTVGAFQFRSSSDLADWKTVQADANADEGSGTCEGNYGQSPWSDAKGRIRGTIFCAIFGGTAEIAWSDNAAHIGYFAESSQNNIRSLLDWWQAHARGGTQSKAGIHLLRKLYGPNVKGGLGSCSTGSSPIADAVIQCGAIASAAEPRQTADTLKLYYFSKSYLLNAFYENYATQYHAPVGTSGVFCENAALVATTYGDPTAGRVFCFPTGGGEAGALWLLWTDDSQHAAGLLQRQDQNQHAIVKMWEDL